MRRDGDAPILKPAGESGLTRVKWAARPVPTAATWRGVLPFIGADILRMAVLIAFPAISLFLPRW